MSAGIDITLNTWFGSPLPAPGTGGNIALDGPPPESHWNVKLLKVTAMPTLKLWSVEVVAVKTPLAAS